jgi:hypothetical protein
MSYIRCTNNPECLYIYWCSSHKIPTVEINRGSALWGGNWPKHAIVPKRNFDAILLKYLKSNYKIKDDHEFYNSGDLTLEEYTLSPKNRPWIRGVTLWFNLQSLFCNIKYWPKMIKNKSLRQMIWHDGYDFQYIMKYKGKVVLECYQTTLEYIAQHLKYQKG